jgi:hypothetical protein
MHRRLLILSLAAALSAACAEPPHKEMNQAQGAIDAAKAAGAEAYAPTELTAAVVALQQSHDAVAARDYRLALNHAIESREQAQAAAKAAVNARARARGDVERQVAEAAALLVQARERLRDPDVSRLPRRTLQAPRATIDAANKSLQDARTALNNDDYGPALKAIDGLVERIQKAIAAIDDAAESAAGSRRRR